LPTAKKAAIFCPRHDIKLPNPNLTKKYKMKLITRDTDYAVRALCFIAAKPDKRVPVSTLVSKLRIPRPFLRHILQVLTQKGILKSYKGLGGGFELSVAPGHILLVDLIRAFQGPLRLNECIFKKKICPNKNICALREKINIIEDRTIAELSSITIESLLKKKGK
jgi:Rrf2 family protein